MCKEKEKIERATAKAFIALYNSMMGTSFSVVKHSDAPDIRCEDQMGNTFNIEITLTEDREADIQAMLGRSDHRTVNASDTRECAGVGPDKASCLQGNVTDMIISRIQKKLAKDYGPDVALVVRDTSPVDWDWGLVLDEIKDSLEQYRNPYDKGIWIITFSKDCIYRVL